MLSHRIDFTIYCIRSIWFELNGMVPRSRRGESLRCFFIEKTAELFVLIWYDCFLLLFFGLYIKFCGDSLYGAILFQFMHYSRLLFFCVSGGDDWKLGNTPRIDQA